MRTLTTTTLALILTTAAGCGWFDFSKPQDTPVTPPPAPATQPTPQPVQTATPTTQPGVSEVMAVINGEKISMDQLHNILVDGYGLAIAQQILRTEIVRQAAESKGLTVNDKEIEEQHQRELAMTFPMADNDSVRQQMLNQLLLSRNVTYSTWRLIMRRKAFLRKMIGTDFEVPDDAVRAAFNARHGRMVVVSHIELKSHVQAKLVKSLAKNRKFEALAKEYSVNPDGQTGGRLPKIGKKTTQVSPALKQVAMAMTKIGELSDPVQVESRFHILKLEEIIEPKKVKYSEEKAKIAAELKEKMISSAGKRLEGKLTQSANVDFTNQSLKKQALQRAAKKP